MKRRKGFTRSGSDSGVSCDGTKSPVNSEKNVELVALEKKMKIVDNGEENKTMEESRGLDHGKLVSNDDCNNIRKKKICTTKASNKVNIELPSTRDSLILNSGLLVTKMKGDKLKCLVENTDDWNRFLLAKSTNKSTSGKRIKVTSNIKKEKCTPNEKEKLELAKVLNENCPEKINRRSCDEVVDNSTEKQIMDSKISPRKRKQKIKQIKTVNSSQNQSLDQSIKNSNVDCFRPRTSNDNRILSKNDEALDSTVTLEVSQATIVSKTVTETNSEEKRRNSVKQKCTRKSSECSEKSALPENNKANYKRKRSGSSRSETRDNSIVHNQEVVPKNKKVCSKSPLKTRSTSENENTVQSVEEKNSLVGEIHNEDICIKTRFKQRLSSTSNEKINIIEPQSNLDTCDVKETNNSAEVQSPLSTMIAKDNMPSNIETSMCSPESQINENLEFRSTKSKKIKITTTTTLKTIKKKQSPMKIQQENLNVDQTNSLETPSSDKNNCDIESTRITELQAKYADLFNCNWNPSVNLERLREFSGNLWVSKNKKNISGKTNNDIKSDPDEILNTHCDPMDLNEIKTENISPFRNSESVVLRDVRIVLEDIRRGEKHRKIIKLNRNWNLTKIESHPKRFQYKFKTDIIPITSRNNLFHEAQLTEGFSFKSPLQTPLILEQISKKENNISMLDALNDKVTNLSEINMENNIELNKSSTSESSDKLDEIDRGIHDVESENVLQNKLSENTPSEIIKEGNNLSKDIEMAEVKNKYSKTENTKHIKTIAKDKMLEGKIRIKLPEKLYKNYAKKNEEISATKISQKRDDVKKLEKSFVEIRKHDKIEKKKKDNIHEHEKNKTKKVSSKNIIPVKLPIQLFKEHEKHDCKLVETKSETITKKIDSKIIESTSKRIHISEDTNTKRESTDNKIKLNEKILKTRRDIKDKAVRKHSPTNNREHKIIHHKHKQLSPENNAHILIKSAHVAEDLELSLSIDTQKLCENLETEKVISSKKDQSFVEKIQESDNIETSPIKQISSENTAHSKPKNIFETNDKNLNLSPDFDSVQETKTVGIVTPEKRLSIETNDTNCNSISQKPKHIFKFTGTSNIKRPPTRQCGKVKLNRPTSSPNIFKVPAAVSSLSQSVRSNSSTQSSPKKISPQLGNSKRRKIENEIDSLSLYAETIGNDSVTDVASVANDSSDDSEDSFIEIYNILPEPAKHTDVHEWVDSTLKICEIKKQNPPLLDKIPSPAQTIVPNNLSSEQESKIISLTNISSESSIEKETDESKPVLSQQFTKHLTTHTYNNTPQCSISSNMTLAIDLFKSVCNSFLKNGECDITSCTYGHDFPPNWKTEINKLPTETMLALYDSAKEMNAIHLYKQIFFPITEHIGEKRDFNTLIRMVKDVIEMDINSDRSPFITIIIDTLCKTGVTFNSIVEFVYKNANVGPAYINLLSDILINLIVDRADCDGNWITIRELLKNINYALDDGIFRAIIVECLQQNSPKRDLFLKVYHDLIKHIADDKLAHLNESILNNFYNRLLKFKLTIEAEKYYERCHSLNITLGNKSDHSNSPASSVANSPATTNVTKNSPFQTSKPDNTHEKISPKTPLTKKNFIPIKRELSQSTHSTPNSSTINFDSATFTSKGSTSSYNYSGSAVVPKKFVTSPKSVPCAPNSTIGNFNPLSSLPANLSAPYQPGPSFIANNLIAPSPSTYSKPKIPRQPPPEQRNRLASDSGFRNNIFNSTLSGSNLSSSTISFPPVPPTYAQILYEVQSAVKRGNISQIFSLIMKYKDNDLTDIFIKTAVEIILAENHNFPTFFTNLCETAKILKSIEEQTVAYVLKTIGLNILLYLTQHSNWEPAFLVYNILRTHFSDLNDILNVKLYLDEKYSYFKRILIIIEIHIKKLKFEAAWTMLKEHILQCNIWQGENEIEITHRNNIINELLSSIGEKKLWRFGLNIVQYVIKNNITNVDVKKHTNAIFLQAINSKCEISVIVEFEKCSPSNWYNYISDVIFRSVVVHTVELGDFLLAKKFYQIGRHFDVYPDLCGNERYVAFKMCYVFNEIWLMFEIFFENMIRFYPIQHNIILKVEDDIRKHAMEDLPMNLQQYKMTTASMQARVANILNNFIKPPVLIAKKNNSLVIYADVVNKHLDARIQKSSIDRLH